MSPARAETLDTRGLLCPQPIVDLSNRINHLAVGSVLTVLSDDPAFALDVEAWCAGCGHDLLELSTGGTHIIARIRKAAS